jgi:hypothetical protein
MSGSIKLVTEVTGPLSRAMVALAVLAEAMDEVAFAPSAP